MKAIIEVGANRGTDTARLASQLKPGMKLFSFEPVPELYDSLKEKYKDNDNVSIHPFAVGEKSKVSYFNITKKPEGISAIYGASSLYPFREDLHQDWSRPDFEMERKITVQVFSLEDFITMVDITEIEYLHCDAQGNDLNVLKGLGTAKDILKAGVIEVTKNIPLYDGVDNSLSSAKVWLHNNGFRITSTRDNDKLGAECNVFFHRR